MSPAAGLTFSIAILSGAAGVFAQDRSAQVVDLAVDRSVTVASLSVSHVLVLDESVCRAEIESGRLRLVGLKRGDTIVVVWTADDTEGHPSTLSVHVTSPGAPVSAEPHLTAEERDAMGHGVVGSLIHVGTSTSGSRSMSMVTPFSWTEGTSHGRFTTYGQIQGSRSTDVANFNVDSATVQWTRGTTVVQLLDYVVDLDGGVNARILPSGPVGSFTLRGADASVSRGRNRYEFFGGTTVPWFAASRQLAGFALDRRQNDRLHIDATSGAVSVPVVTGGTPVDRQFSVFQTIGLTERFNEHAAVQIRGGAATNGFYAQGATTWLGERGSVFASATGSSPQFGLNQLPLVYSPSGLVRAGASWKPLRRLTTGIGFDHTSTEATPLLRARSTSDSLSNYVSVAVTPSQTVFANSMLTRTVGGLAMTPETTGRRFDAGASSRFGAKIANSFQFSSGALADPLQVESRSEFSLRDSVTFSLEGGSSLNISFSHDRLSPSLVASLRQQINLLAPELQLLFADDPIAFVESPLMPPEVRQLVASLQPVDTQVTVSGQFHLGPRVNVAPTFSYVHSAQSATLATMNEMAGYALTWRVTPTLDVQSSLTNAIVLDPRRRDFARTTVFGIGLRKTLNGAPRWVVPSAGYRIGGRIFRDLNIDGLAEGDEPGLPGVPIHLSNGRTTRTDDKGRFEFGRLDAGEYHVLMALDQVGDGARATTPVDQIVRLYERRTLDVDFGVVNFSRLMGNVFNDYALNGERQPDAPGLRGIGIVVTGPGGERHLVSDAAGDFEIDDIAPGRYEISIDPQTVPPNHVSEATPIGVEVAPSATAIVNLPVRALRSLGGRVYLRARAGSVRGDAASLPSTLIPLKGVRVAARGTIVVTDEDGRFLFRNLPAGELPFSIVPITPVPGDLQAPSGTLKIPTGPLQIEDATIVIDNPRLVDYLVSGFR